MAGVEDQGHTMNTRLQTRSRTSTVPDASFTSVQVRSLVCRPPLLQPKLTLNPPGDRYEEEADRVAEQVMTMPEPRIQRAPT